MFIKNSSKRKRKLTEVESSILNPIATTPDIYYGMTKANENSYEVWAHEDCVVWSSGVHIIGTRIVGLEAAVWSSSKHKCSVCSEYGSVLSCLQRGCKDEVHVPCAKRTNWDLCEIQFKSWCAKHRTQVDSSD